jgi:hypothetical protein
MNLHGGQILRNVNRIPPKGPTRLYKTYQVSSPLRTHYRQATCAEVQCEHYLKGWALRADILQPRDLQLIKDSRRKYIVENRVEGTKDVQWLLFEAGQPCFKASTHRIAIGRPEIYRVGKGDWRSYKPQDAYVHKSPEDWLDDFANHQDKIVRIQERG